MKRPTDRADHHPAPERPVSIGLVVAGSMAAGFATALVLVLLVFAGAREHVIGGATLLAFAFSWLLLAGASIRFTAQPQRWAFLPAALSALAGLAFFILKPGNEVLETLGWVWPIPLVALTAWMFVHARRQLHSRTRRLLLYPMFGILLLSAFGGGYETIREATAPHGYATDGQLVDVGGYELYLSCAGSGSPTVVLEPGLGAISSAFGWIRPAVEQSTRVCVYDRAGRGLSQDGLLPPSGEQVAADLHHLLEQAHVPGPYVLVGHSFGGLYSLTFAARYPDDIAGLVLLDSTSPEAVERRLAGWPRFYGLYRRASALFPSLARLGVMRLVYDFSYGGLPPDARDELRASFATARQARSQRDEFAQALASMRQAQALQDFGDKPLIVVAAGSGSGHGAEWLAAQEDLANLSTNSLYRLVPHATHGSLLDDENDAAISSQAIADVVHAVRTGTPLATRN